MKNSNFLEIKPLSADCIKSIVMNAPEPCEEAALQILESLTETSLGVIDNEAFLQIYVLQKGTFVGTLIQEVCEHFEERPTSNLITSALIAYVSVLRNLPYLEEQEKKYCIILTFMFLVLTSK